MRCEDCYNLDGEGERIGFSDGRPYKGEGENRPRKEARDGAKKEVSNSLATPRLEGSGVDTDEETHSGPKVLAPAAEVLYWRCGEVLFPVLPCFDRAKYTRANSTS